jgi:hypothetical protein
MMVYRAAVGRRRWGDNDKHFGPFTFSFRETWKPLAIVLSSGDEEREDCCIRFQVFGTTMICELPQIVKPWRKWVDLRGKEWAQSDGYWDEHPREYGFCLSEGHLHVKFGAQTGDSSTTQDWGCFLPWTEWRHIRHSFYGLQGEHVATLPDTGKSYLGNPSRWEQERAIADATPTASFEFEDFDGERIVATTRIEECEWRAGVGWFKWLALFRKARVSRSLDLRFSSEVGKRKGSWKGGTVGHSIEMLPGELHEAAFRRYCTKEGLLFVKRTGQ